MKVDTFLFKRKKIQKQIVRELIILKSSKIIETDVESKNNCNKKIRMNNE